MTSWSDYFVSPEWLLEHLEDPGLRVVDGSWYLDPARDGHSEYIQQHIPGAVFFDLDTIADRSVDLPHMLPSPEAFGDAVGELGISNEDAIIVYDGAGLFSAARVWWTFKVMGATNVQILDGGLPAWIDRHYPLTDEIFTPQTKNFLAKLDYTKIADLAAMKKTSKTAGAAILDARPRARFDGAAPEPRAGLRSGHMPNSQNLPASELIENGSLKKSDLLAKTFNKLGLKPDDPVITTCGSGVTAAILTLSLAVAGWPHSRLYDGSWAEWASQPDTDVLNNS